jgi:tRNA wybutosine-synthesizing protein 2
MKHQSRHHKHESDTSFFGALWNKLQGKIPEELMELLPRGFQELEKNVILRLKPELEPYQSFIAEAIHELYPAMKAVWTRGDIVGQFREPSGLKLLWGLNDPIVTVTENSVKYRFDFTKIMFAKGNMHERQRIPKKIAKDDVVVDMFAGIGYFSLGIAKHSEAKKVYSIELNPVSYEFLRQNIALNKLESIIEPIHGDCKLVVPELAQRGIKADKILMGIIPEPVEYIPAALSVSKPGTIIFYEGVDKEDGQEMFQRFKSSAGSLGKEVELVEVRVVKNYKPHLFHVVDSILIKS